MRTLRAKTPTTLAKLLNPALCSFPSVAALEASKAKRLPLTAELLAKFDALVVLTYAEPKAEE